MSSDELVELTGISYRVLDHCVRRGYLRPIGGVGSGYRRRWPQEEVALVRRVAEIHQALDFLDYGVLLGALHDRFRRGLPVEYSGEWGTAVFMPPPI